MAGAKCRNELGDEILRRTLQELSERATKLARAVNNIGDRLEESTGQRILRREVPDGDG